MSKGSLEKLLSGRYEVVLLQEIRSSGEVPLTIMNMGYLAYPFPARRKGYSGVMTLTLTKPISVIKGLGIGEFDEEGRVITIELNNLYIVNAYFPRAGDDLGRLDFKIRFCQAIERFLEGLRARKPVVICGDFNIARDRIDSSFWDEKHPGLTPEERAWFRDFLSRGYVDVLRELHPGLRVYTWRSYREREKAMRLDYCVVSSELMPRVRYVGVLEHVEGSDHKPVMLQLDL